MTDTPTPDVRPQPYTPLAPATGGGAGTAALVIGLVLVVIGLVQQVLGATVSLWVVSFEGYSQVGMVFGAFGIVTVFVAIGGIVAGLIGIQQGRERGRLAAAAGLAISATHLLSAIVAFVAPLVVGLLA